MTSASTVPEPGAPVTNRVTVNQAMIVPESQEPAVAIGERFYNRYLQRLEECKPGGWADLWLALTGVGGGLAAASLVTALALPPTVSAGLRDVLWMLVALGAITMVLCLLGYFSQRAERGRQIRDLKADLELHKTAP